MSVFSQSALLLSLTIYAASGGRIGKNGPMIKFARVAENGTMSWDSGITVAQAKILPSSRMDGTADGPH
jgi:hypothetical protein